MFPFLLIGELSVGFVIEFALFDAIDKLLDLGRISGGDVIVVFHRRRSRRSYARQKRTPRPERKYFLFSRVLTAGTRSIALHQLADRAFLCVASSPVSRQRRRRGFRLLI